MNKSYYSAYCETCKDMKKEIGGRCEKCGNKVNIETQTFTKPLFTKKHYKAIAKRIAETNIMDTREKRTSMVVLSNLFGKDNPKFDEKKFYQLFSKELK